MKNILTFLVGLLLVGPALAQSSAPAVEYYFGPSLGKLWLAPESLGILSLNAQTGTTYTIAATDWQKLVTLSNASPIAVTLPQAGTGGFEVGKCFNLVAIGAGTATVTPTTSTINGQSTKTYATSAGGKICSDGTNYYAY